MKKPFSQRRLFAVVAFCTLLALLLMVCLTPGRLPPSVSIALLGYKNGVGPYALLAITNRTDFAVSLESTCLVQYSPTQGPALRRVTSIDANTLRVTRLPPKTGFVQEVFVFPGSQGEWQFECFAAPSSSWANVKRFAENQVRKILGRQPLPKAGYTFSSEWESFPSM